MKGAIQSILPLTVAGARVERDGRTLLAIDQATLGAGRRTVVLGPNGAGKSLFLKLCHGLIEPTGGVVHFALPGGVAAGRKAHAMVFQKPVLLRRSVFANFIHPLALAGHGFAERRRRARAALARFGLAALADRPARVLSGGEQQRLAIARAASLEPQLLFLDEPCSSLDPSASRQVEDMLLALHAGGVTLVMATHDLGQARRLAEDVLFIHRGRLLESGPAETFFASPRTEEAQAFLESRLFW
jgi:tungstate transport system ATP-binding protein